MEKSKISRRKFVGTAALGAGSLAILSSSKLFAAEVALTPVVQNVWKQGREYIMDFAKAMPADKYGFKPTEEVFSFAGQLLHLADTNYWVFSTIKGEKPFRSEDDSKAEGKTKEEVVKILEESFAYGDDVISGFTDASIVEEVGGRRKLANWKRILFCAEHITHHRGQIVTYLRLNGIVPPKYRSGFYG